MKTYSVGHKNPDTDSVVSAIALAELDKKMGKDFEAAIAGEINKETEYVLNKFNFNVPRIISSEEKKVFLVDHNEPSQVHENIRTEEIVGIIDHHKLGGLSTVSPISIRIKPVGSTSTIMAQIFKDKKVEISPNLAGLLLSGIISDTWKFTSPTSTEEDVKEADFLNSIAKIDLTNLAEEMFKAKSDLTGLTIEKVVNADYKEFNIKGKNIGVGVFETLDPKPALERKEEIIKTLEDKKTKEKLNYLLFAVIDVIKRQAYFITASKEDEELVNNVFNPKNQDNILVADEILSRKKQIIPSLEKYF